MFRFRMSSLLSIELGCPRFTAVWARSCRTMRSVEHLRRTSRLKDLLRERNYVIQYKDDEIREAEFVTDFPQSARAPSYPNALDFETIAKLMEPGPNAGSMIFLKRKVKDAQGAPNAHDPALRKVAEDANGESLAYVDLESSKFEVLWLSSTEFISNVEFCLSGAHLWHYHVWLCRSDRRRPGYLYASSSSLFTDNSGHDVPIPNIHLHFLRHIVSPLPVNFWRKIELTEGKGYFSAQLCSLFLRLIRPNSILSQDIARSSQGLSKTTLCLTMKIDKDKMEAIAGHEFNRHVELEFGKFREAPPDLPPGVGIVPWEKMDKETLPMSLLNRLLYESIYLRHFCIPLSLVEFECTDAASFAASPNFESLTIKGAYNGDISLQLLNGIALNPSIKELYIDFRCGGNLPRDGTAWKSLTHLFQNVVAGHPSLNGIVLKFNNRSQFWNTWRSHEFRDAAISCIAAAMAGAVKQPKLGSLISLKLLYEYFSNGEEELQSNALWDTCVSPTLAVNWHRHQMNHQSLTCTPLIPMQGGLIGHALCSINQGTVYSKTSPMALENASISNAGVIYDCLRTYFVSLEAASAEDHP
jgi:hypothetical protein